MKDIVVIKGNKFGLNVQMDAEVEFDAIKEVFVTKLKKGKKFFGSSTISIDFAGRHLDHEEEQTMVNLIHQHTDMEVFCIVDDDMPVVMPKDMVSDKGMIKETVVEKVYETVIQNNVPREALVFHQGTLRSGQELDVASGVVIIGDVNPGAKVTASGNIVILGSLKGYAHAGNSDTEGAFVFALSMCPTQIRINRVIARSPDQMDDIKSNPQIAYLEENRIVIEQMHNTLYKDYKFFS